MDFAPLHPWDLEQAAAVELQRQLAEQVCCQARNPIKPQTVAGVDVSCAWRGDLFHAAVVLLSFPELQPLATVTASARSDFPYRPGLLSFRELPVILQAFGKLQLAPDLILVDGQGIAHPRGIGLASHLGLWLGLPTIGCAKSRLYGNHEPVGEQRGQRQPLQSPQGKKLGLVLRTRDRVKPLYVSPGHLLDPDQAADLVLACGRGYRLPEPTRLAHLASNQQRRKEEPAGQSRS